MRPSKIPALLLAVAAFLCAIGSADAEGPNYISRMYFNTPDCGQGRLGAAFFDVAKYAATTFGCTHNDQIIGAFQRNTNRGGLLLEVADTVDPTFLWKPNPTEFVAGLAKSEFETAHDDYTGETSCSTEEGWEKMKLGKNYMTGPGYEGLVGVRIENSDQECYDANGGYEGANAGRSPSADLMSTNGRTKTLADYCFPFITYLNNDGEELTDKDVLKNGPGNRGDLLATSTKKLYSFCIYDSSKGQTGVSDNLNDCKSNCFSAGYF